MAPPARTPGDASGHAQQPAPYENEARLGESNRPRRRKHAGPDTSRRSRPSSEAPKSRGRALRQRSSPHRQPSAVVVKFLSISGPQGDDLELDAIAHEASGV